MTPLNWTTLSWKFLSSIGVTPIGMNVEISDKNKIKMDPKKIAFENVKYSFDTVQANLKIKNVAIIFKPEVNSSVKSMYNNEIINKGQRNKACLYIFPFVSKTRNNVENSIILKNIFIFQSLKMRKWEVTNKKNKKKL